MMLKKPDIETEFFKTLKTRAGCVHCINAIEHTIRHNKYSPYISCRAHKFVDVCKARYGEFENPSHNDKIKCIDAVEPFISSVDGFEILAIGGGVQVATSRGDVANLYVVVAGVVEHDEYIHRHQAVLVENFKPMSPEGDSDIEWTTLLHDTDSVVAVAFASCLAGGHAVDTCVNGNARESQTMIVPFVQRSSCHDC